MYVWTKGFYKTAYSPTISTNAQGNIGGFTPQTYEIHVALQDTYAPINVNPVRGRGGGECGQGVGI